MTFTNEQLSQFNDDVRGELAELEISDVPDQDIYKQLKKANRFITQISCPNADETDVKYAVIDMAVYLAYLVYTARYSKDYNAVPDGYSRLYPARKERAYGSALLISCVPITPDLTIDTKSIRGSIILANKTDSVYDDDS